MEQWQPDIVIYHDKCIDGFTAAWVCWQRWPGAEYVADNYGPGLPDLAALNGKRILIVDFSYPPAVLEELVTVWGAHSIVMLDHHKTAQEQFGGQDTIFFPKLFSLDDVNILLTGCETDMRPPILVAFDMERSGAGMAWDFAQFGQPRPHLVSLVEDRDLWRFAYGDDSRHLHLALSTLEKDFTYWDAAAETCKLMVERGRSMASYRDGLIAEICERAWMTEIAGKPAITVDCPYGLVSETGHKLLELHPDAAFAAMRVAGEHAITFSLRSEDDREDVSAIASRFGGGGHRNAAGFRVPR